MPYRHSARTCSSDMRRIFVTAFAVAFFAVSGLFALFALNLKTATGIIITAATASTFLWSFWVFFIALAILGLMSYLHQSE